MRCVLHIGIEKTGSTALQHFLHNNWEGLKHSGTHVCTSVGKPNNRSLPAAFMAEDRADEFLRRMRHETVKDRRRWKKQLLKTFTKEVAQAKKKSDTFLISSEHFHSRLCSPAEVHELSLFLQPLFDSVTVICYLRRQDHLGLSRYSEAMRAGHVQTSPLPLVFRNKRGGLPLYFNFEALLERWSTSFGESNIKPRIYSREDLLNGDIIDDFCSIAGLDMTHLKVAQGSNVNTALSAEAQTVLLGVNRALKELGRTESDRRLRGKLARYLQKNAPGKSRQPTSAAAKEFYGKFEESNSRVAAQWFNRQNLFDTDFSAYPDTPPEVCPEEVVELLAGFMMEHID